MFPPVSEQPDTSALERQVLARWKQEGTADRTRDDRAGGQPFSLVERLRLSEDPDLAQLQAHVLVDLVARHRAMTGHRVSRRVTWDDHGPALEVEVERQLGTTVRADIAAEGIAAFTDLCRETAEGHRRVLARLSERLGVWTDVWSGDQAPQDGQAQQDHHATSTARGTTAGPTSAGCAASDRAAIERAWWSLAQLRAAGLLLEQRRVLPWCGRCGTALGHHEVAHGGPEVDGPSTVVRVPVVGGPLEAMGASLAVWTTSPWTVLASPLIAVSPDIGYVLALAGPDGPAAGARGPVVIAAARAEAILGPDVEVLRNIPPAELIGLRHRPPIGVDAAGGEHSGRVVSAERASAGIAARITDQIASGQGTGLVHLAPAVDPEAHAVALREGLAVADLLDADGRLTGTVPTCTGMTAHDADAQVLADLRDAGLLLRAGTQRHTPPRCRACGTPLLQRAATAWFIAATSRAGDLRALEDRITWHAGVQHEGRAARWLPADGEWMVSRSRSWGVPLPIWRCDTGQADHDLVVGSLAELGRLAGQDLADLDPHRPQVDALTGPCARPDCEGTLHRVPDVLDARYDATGAQIAPFAQPDQAVREGSAESPAERLPADLAVEPLDPPRSWVLPQLVAAALLGDTPPFAAVLQPRPLTRGDGVDGEVDHPPAEAPSPQALVDRQGADPLRWLLLTGAVAGEDGATVAADGAMDGELDAAGGADGGGGHGDVEAFAKHLLLPLWTAHHHLTEGARRSAWTPATSRAPALADRPILDRWILAELAGLVHTVTEALAGCDTRSAGRALEGFAADLAGWYLPRRRRAPDDGDPDPSGLATLHECLVTVAALLAPFVPFLAEALYADLVRSVDATAPDSVHQLDHPRPDAAAHDPDLRTAMRTARRIVALGVRARAEAGVAVGQPLPRAQVDLPDAASWEDAVSAIVAEALDVKALELRVGGSGGLGGPARLRPDFRELGRAFGTATPDVAVAVALADADAHVAALRAGRPIDLPLPDGRSVAITPAMVRIVEPAREGWQVAAEGTTSVALELAVDDGLRREWLARELSRTIGELRARQGLAPDDGIRVELAVDGQLRQALADHRPAIMRDTMAITVTEGPAGGPAAGDGRTSSTFVEVGGHAARIRIDVDRPQGP